MNDGPIIPTQQLYLELTKHKSAASLVTQIFNKKAQLTIRCHA